MSGIAIARLVLVAATLGVTAGCGSGSAPSTTPPTVTVTVTPTPTASASSTPGGTGTAGAPAETDLSDGRHPVRITKVDAAHRQITVDVVQFFTGTAASSAAKADRAPEVPPPNDYWIRNTNPRLRTLPVAPGAPITVNVLAALESGSAGKDVPKTLTQLAGYHQPLAALFWVTVTDGKVTKISEQFLP